MSVKLLEVAGDARGDALVSPTADGIAVLKKFPAEAINFVTVFGAARSGKSFLLNALADEVLFKVSGAMKPCTSGADLCKALRSVGDFENGGQTAPAWGASSSRPSSSETPWVGFVDVEGQGDKNPLCDVLLATPLLLLSKITIFNWKGRPAKSAMLDQLALMVNAANQVECAHRQSAFGHLIVVLRDVPRESHEGQKLVFDDEDLGAASRGEQDSINQRNRSRAELRSAFKSIQMLALPSPHEDIDWSDGVNLTDLKPSFKEVMTKFRDLVAKLLADPHTFGGEPVLGGDILSKLLSDVCANVNDKKNDIAPCSLMESILKKPVDDLRAKAEKDFQHRVATFESGDGIHSEADTTLFIDGARRDAVTSFNRGAQVYPAMWQGASKW